MSRDCRDLVANWSRFDAGHVDMPVVNLFANEEERNYALDAAVFTENADFC